MGEHVIEDRKVRRGRLWKWTLVIIGAIVAMLVSLRLFWGWQAENMVKRELAAIKARGEPITWAEFAPASISDNENAAELYKQAMALVPKPAGASSTHFIPAKSPGGSPVSIPVMGDAEAKADKLKRDLFGRDFRREHQAELNELLEAASSALELCQRAAALKRSDWKLKYEGTGFVPDPSLRELRELVRLALLDCYRAHEDGDDERAIQSLASAMAMANSADASPTLLSHLVALACQRMTCSTIEDVASTLRFDSDERLRSEARRLIRQLLDESGSQAAFPRALMAERVQIFGVMEETRAMAAKSRSLSDGHATLFKCCPQLFAADEVFVLQFISKYVEAAKESDYPAFSARRPAPPPSETGLAAYAHIFRNIVPGTLTKVGGLHFTGIAQGRMAATALAIRLFELDHGRRPEKLDELKGQYLPDVPVDPFDPAKQALRYLPKANPPLMYSVCLDGADDGGSYLVDSSGQTQPEKSKDLVWFLSGDRPQSTATSRATSGPASASRGAR